MSAWLQLFRIALAPSVIWDALAGAALAWVTATAVAPDSPWEIDAGSLSWTVLCLLCVFHAGMAWNDWADRRVDQAAGRARPLADGRLTPTAGLLAGGVLLLVALGIAWWQLPEQAKLILALAATVAVYDLGGKAFRAVAGPVLLAICRMLSLLLGMLVVVGPRTVVEIGLHWPLITYGLYLLFLSRLASHEEEGLPGVRAVVPVAACAFAPVVLVSATENPLPVVLLWLGFAAWLLPPAIRARHQDWSPAQVQAQVRRCLVGMPMIPALALVAAPGTALLPAAGGLLTIGLTRLLVRRFPPE